MSQTNKHKADHRHINERFAGLGQPLVVSAQPAVTGQPSEGTFHHPSPGQHHKPSLPRLLLHDMQGPTQHTLDPLYKLSSVTPVCPYQLQPTIAPPVRVLRFLGTLVERFEQHFSS